MCLSQPKHQRHQAGFGMPVVLFILVVMALLAAAMVRLSTTGALSIANEVDSNRAFYAAESGAQWAMNRLFPPTGGGGVCFTDTTLNFGASGLNGCSAAVQCQATGVFNGSNHFVITSSGNCQEATRVLQVGAKQ